MVDVLFAEASTLTLEHRTPERTYSLASITVGDPATALPGAPFEHLRTNAEMVALRSHIEPTSMPRRTRRSC